MSLILPIRSFNIEDYWSTDYTAETSTLIGDFPSRERLLNGTTVTQSVSRNALNG